jgi:putative DNA primase/helicase
VIVNRPNEEHVTVRDSVRVLRNDDALFQRGGKLVHVARDLSGVGRDPDGDGSRRDAPRIRVLPRDVLRNRLSELARHMKQRKKDNVKISDAPMDSVVRTIHALGSWEGIRAIDGITECPVLRPDGTVVDTPGYDQDTRLVFEPSGKFLAVAPHPTGAEVASAVNFLCDEVVCDFPFERPAHMGAWVASLLSVLGRPAVNGPVPMFAIDSNTRGSGKSRLCDLVAIAATGRDMPRMPGAGNEEEWRKRIAMIALAGSPMILLDNVRRLASESLEGAITGTSIADRQLGGLDMAEAEIRAVWFATGNNVSMSTDLIRRSIHIRLESKDERPEERTDFKHADLLAWARTERARILHAGLTILRGYFDAGRPEQRLRSLGSFEAWSGIVRCAVVWAGLPDPCETRAGLASAADDETALLRRLISAWEGELGSDPYSIREVCHQFENDGDAARIQKSMPQRGPLFDVFVELRPPVGGSFDVAKLGYAFRKFKGRVVDGRRLESVEDRNGIMKWRVAGSNAGDPPQRSPAGKSPEVSAP